MTLLRDLELGQNLLTGTLPESWQSLELLMYLFLPENQFNGSLPKSWGASTIFPSLQLL